MIELKSYRFTDYKQIAHAYLTKHGLLLKRTLPIDIEVLIDKSGITIHAVNLMYKDFGVKGSVLKKTGGYDIERFHIRLKNIKKKIVNQFNRI